MEPRRKTGVLSGTQHNFGDMPSKSFNICPRRINCATLHRRALVDTYDVRVDRLMLGLLLSSAEVHENSRVMPYRRCYS